jgi:DNA replication protein DnaC
MDQQLMQRMKSLRLSGMASTMEVRNTEAIAASLSHLEFLELLVEDELGIRADRLLKRRLKQARFPALKTLEDFDFTYNPSIDKRQILDLATARFVSSAQGILLQGPPGTGKSHLAIAIAIRAIHAGYPVLYRSALDLLEDLAEAEALDDRKAMLKNLVKAPLLIIDDLGLNRTPPGAAQNLMELFMRRYEQTATIVTTNRPVEDWGKMIGDPVAATAILDRFLHHAAIITIKGRSYRLRNQAKADNKKK